MATTLMDPRPARERYEALRGQLWTERSSFDAHWRELGDFLLPRRTRFWAGDRNKGDRRSQHIIDSTARFSARTLQSGLHAGLTSPARPWFKLGTPDPDLAEFGPVKEWLHVVTQRMLTIFAQTNLYNTLPIIYGDMGVFGTAAMAIVEDTRDLFRCYAFPIGSYAVGLDDRGLATTFARDYELTVRQVVEQFGVRPGRTEIDWSTISPAVKRLWETSQYEAAVPLTWIVLPNPAPRPDAIDARAALPWVSCHFERGAASHTLLRESGFRAFPVMAPRWDITGEDAYGTDCPGMTALGDVKQLQAMQREKGKAIVKMVTPPLVGPTSLSTQKVSLVPGDVTYQDVRDGMQGLKSIHEIRIDLQHLSADIGETQYRIQRAFYEDLFLMIAQSDRLRGAQPVTAREIDERHEEKLLALGPVLERTNDELLDRIIDRVYGQMEHAGLLPEPPEELDGVRLRVEYISIMAQAQKLVGVVGQDRFLQTVAPLMQVFPEIRHKIDVFRVVDGYADMLGVDPRIVRPTEAAQQAQAQEAQQQQALLAADQAKSLAGAVKDAGTTPMDGDTALTRLVGAGV